MEDVIAEGDKAACRVSQRATHRGTFQGMPATGKQVTQTGIDILRFADGKIVERWGEFDSLGLLAQLEPAPLSPWKYGERVKYAWQHEQEYEQVTKVATRD